MQSKIIGIGSCLPNQVVTNEALAKFFNEALPKRSPTQLHMDPSWIRRKLGIEQRRLSFNLDTGKMNGPNHDVDLAERAIDLALKNADVTGEMINMLLHATATPGHIVPDQACQLHSNIWASGGSFGTITGCAGFLYQLITADALIQSKKAHYVIVSGSNCVSPYFQALNHLKQMNDEHIRNDRLAAAFFGDGAGAIVLGSVEPGTMLGKEEKVIVATTWGADDTDNPVKVMAGGSFMPTSKKTVEEGQHCFQLNMRAVLGVGVSHLTWMVERVLRKADVSINDVNHFVFHQASTSFLKAVIRKLRLPRDRVPINCDRYGNTVNATIPITLDELVKSNKIHKGDLVLLAAVGDGWQYGAVLIRW